MSWSVEPSGRSGLPLAAAAAAALLIAPRTTSAQPLLAAYEEEKRTLLSVIAGLGVEGLLMARWSVRVEGRVVEGVSEMFDGPRGSIRRRGTELLMRVGRRPSGQGPPR